MEKGATLLRHLNFKEAAVPSADNPFSLAPIRIDFRGGESLGRLGAELASDAAPELFSYIPFNFASRLRGNQRRVLANYRSIQQSLRDKAQLSPAAEWLLDNHHIVEENFRHLRRDLTPLVYRDLPTTTLSDGSIVPRVLALGWLYVAATNSEVALPGLSELVGGFQAHQVLTIGELWAFPAILRFVLLENLRRLSDRVEYARRKRVDANALADRLAAQEATDVAALAGQHRADATIGPFAAQLLYRLRDGSGTAPEALRWLESCLQDSGTDPEQIIAIEHGRQSSSNVTVGNIIRSLRTIDEVDWFKWFESVSHVDRLLRRDPDYGKLDKATRNAYREAIERIARRSPLTETEVTQAALARVGHDKGNRTGEALVGIDAQAFESECGYRPRIGERVFLAYRRLGWLGIFLPALCITVVIAALMIRAMPHRPLNLPEIVLFLLALVPASEAAMGLVNLIGARLLRTRLLPAYDFDEGIPETSRTLVVIPCLLSGFDEADDLIRTLELHYLANPRGDIHFALLSDWADSPTETRPEDQAILDHARDGIEALAARYADTGPRRFYLLHRCRLYNPQEGVWMGWERKRGKLAELNQLLRGVTDTTFIDTGPRPPEGIRFVVTVDADTRLPRDVVAKLAGKLAHPVNRPVVDPKTGRVVRGYSILQPRLTPSLTTGSEASVFQRVFSVDRGLDPYVFTVSDLYQDLLGEGSYTGKGIYDVDAFRAATEQHIPENTVLSHDLLEGSLARAALVSDITMVEDFPVDYTVETSRQRRWARGDWQLLPFFLRPDRSLNATARLKMTDNLRRSLVAPTWVAASVLGWITLPELSAIRWQLLLLLTLFVTPMMSFNTRFQPSQPGVSWLRHFVVVSREAVEHLAAIAMRLCFIAHQAAVMMDALLRTLYRLIVSRRHLLEWRSAGEVAAEAEHRPRDYLRAMLASPVIAVVAVVLVAVLNPQNLPLAAGIAAFWIAAPFVAWDASRTLETEDTLRIRPEDATELRRIARITWRFFEEFVSDASNHLPPDNYQDTPLPKLAERTSPTNIGLYLLSVLSARDLGWIGMPEALSRITATLHSIERLEKYRGHLFNWYDTRNLQILSPQYISSVDSGNLAGHLVTLSSALKTWARNPLVHVETNPDGIGDVLEVLRHQLDAVPDRRRALRPLRRRLQERIEGFGRTYATYRREPELAPVRSLGLSVIAGDIRTLALALLAEDETEAMREVLWWVGALRANCEALIGPDIGDRPQMRELAEQLDSLAERARAIAFSMDFGFLMDPESRLLSIGFRRETEQLDKSSYDLLASEARLASFFAIAKGDLPNEHWLRLGRPVTTVGWAAALLSWSGSMFEYLMPPLVMQERSGGILNQSNLAAVKRQIRYGRTMRMPWGVSECAFNARDPDMNYQYHAFGVPALGLKRSLAHDSVVAPYATALASQFRPKGSVTNFRRLADLGAMGRYGYYDAVDFTRTRIPDDADHIIVRTVMAHHQGMTIAAIANAVLSGIHRGRFHADPVVQAAELLLQEKSPREIVPITRPLTADDRSGSGDDLNPVAQTIVNSPATKQRAIALLSNGSLSFTLTSTGSGYAQVGELALTRWKPDPVQDSDGIFLFLRDCDSNVCWSATVAPREAPGETAAAIFSDHKAEFTKSVNGIESHLEVIVASEADAAAHRLTLRNTGTSERDIEVTSYGEIVLDTPAADAAHPAFSKMFVRTKIESDAALITARRNQRGSGGRDLQLAHLICGPSAGRHTSAETDRHAFIGRGRSLADAAVFDEGATLTGSEGFTLDPIFALRRSLRIAPGKSVTLTFWTIAAEGREALERAVSHYGRPETFDHESRLAWSRSQVQLRHLDTSLEDAALFRRFAEFLLYPDLRLTAQDAEIRAALGPQSALWAMGISGDFPIFLLRVDNEADLRIVRQSLRMHEFFRARGVNADLVIVNERESSYAQGLQTAISVMCEASIHTAQAEPKRVHVFALRRDQMERDAWRKLLAASRIVLHTRNGKLSEQLARLVEAANLAGTATFVSRRRMLPAPKPARQPPSSASALSATDLDFWNGYGGFAAGSREYVIRLRHGEQTPHPWINVIGREDFGFHVSAEGAGYTWAANSRDYQITPWSNDPVINRPGEAIYVRDSKHGRLATPFAALSDNPGANFEIRHGMGQSRFLSRSDWIEVEAVQVLAADGPAKLTRLRLTNLTDEPLKLDCVAYAELVLGNDRARSAPMIRVGGDGGLHAVLARNPYGMDFQGRTMALACDRPPAAHCVSRIAFLGRGRSMARPAALTGSWPDGRAANDPAGDPCAALMVTLDLAPGESGEVLFILADAPDAEIRDVVRAAMQPGAHEKALRATAEEWETFLGRLQVETPDRKLDLMVNTWLPYQALACRIRARSAFYQASGAFGFRDQLQDTAALILHDPALARRQILAAAGRQFTEGDVQHWWLPRTGAGVRTTISDDVVWLAYLTAYYVTVTGDAAILEESVPFLSGKILEPGQHDAFFTPDRAEESAPLYEHCVRALDLAIRRTGKHGLPLILGGDWNDGMNLVGIEGRGESVWLGWMLCATLDAFIPLAKAQGDKDHAAAWRKHRKALGVALESDGWDGDWYRRGYYDDGTPLGSAQSEECRIDSIAQTWAVISGAGQPDRAATAIGSALSHLVDPDARTLRLFTPPFEKTDKEPGYIKAYPPGVRENGGQYTHAATWMVYALAMMGRGSEAHEIFDLLNPISHSTNRADADRYRVEPYVVAADIYSGGDKSGRGGWTWYTGSAGWLYRTAVESILGIRLERGKLRVTPALPDDWPGYTATLRHADRDYRIAVTREGERGYEVRINGKTLAENGSFGLD